ncbi:MAG: FAD-linked oxidase C-terminal domain-containing protein [Methylococcaceae bacterium]
MITVQPHSDEKIEHSNDKQTVVAALKKILPKDSILFEQEALKPYECDGLAVYHCEPWLVVLPETVDQVQKILTLCFEWGIPVVARGAGTGLSGGAIPLANGILMSLTKFNRILEIDAANRLAIVQPGVRNLAISQAVKDLGLFYAPDPSSQIACSIGGNIAENSGGVHCLKYGLTTHNVLAVKAVTMDGELVTLGGHGLDGPGYDLLALMNGSEGLLAVVVEATVKLTPLPEKTQVMMAVFDTIQTAGHAVAGLIAAGVVPAGLEMMDQRSIRAVEEFVHAGYPIDAAAILLCEIDGPRAQVEIETPLVQALFLTLGAIEVQVAQTEDERTRMWAGRKAAFAAAGRMSPDYYCMDGTIPRRHLATMLQEISKWSEQYGLAVANVFHAGDGNLHPLILFDAEQPGELAKAEALGANILALSVALGGTITGEHGVGIEKINQMCIQFKPEEITQFHALKRAFDAKGLLNPGKAIPSLNRCAEFGAMHVKEGRLKHSELERF